MTRHEEKVFDNRYQLALMTDAELEEFIRVARKRNVRHYWLWLLTIGALFLYSVTAGAIGIGVYVLRRLWVVALCKNWLGEACHLQLLRAGLTTKS